MRIMIQRWVNKYLVIFYYSFRPCHDMTILEKSTTHKRRTLFLLKDQQSCFLRFNLLLRYKELKTLSVSRYYTLGLTDMAGTDVDTFRTAWVPVNVTTALLNTPHVCTAVYVLLCSLINKKTSLVLVELLNLYKISPFFQALVSCHQKIWQPQTGPKYDNHKQALNKIHVLRVITNRH